MYEERSCENQRSEMMQSFVRSSLKQDKAGTSISQANLITTAFNMFVRESIIQLFSCLLWGLQFTFLLPELGTPGIRWRKSDG